MPTRFILWLRMVAICASALVTSGCASDLIDKTRIVTGPNPVFDADQIGQSTDKQDAVVKSLRQRAGLSTTGDIKDSEWVRIVDAGVEYADVSCERYLATLDRLNRDKKTVVTQLGLFGTATAGIMAAAKSAARDVAMVAILFGLASSTVENFGSNLLYDIDPSSVRVLVKALQTRYKESLQNHPVLNRPLAMRAIQDYAVLCTPANIEAEVNIVVKQASPGVQSSGSTPYVSNAVAVVFSNDSDQDALSNFVFSNGAIDAEHLKTLQHFLEQRKVTVPYPVVLHQPQYAALRAEAVRELIKKQP